MKITDIKVRRYSKKFKKPISNGKYTYEETSKVVCQINTDEKVYGIGWVEGKDIVFTAIKRLEEYLISEDPFNVEKIWSKIYLPKIFGTKGLTTRAISAVDITLWDIIGKIVEKPLYQILGGFRDRVPAYIAGGYYEDGKSLSDLVNEMKNYTVKGARAVRMKIGRKSIEEDMERIKAVQNEIGDNIHRFLLMPITHIIKNKLLKSVNSWMKETYIGLRNP